MKGNFSEILEKYRLKRKNAHNFRKFQVSYVFFITEILQQIFQNFTNMLRKSEKLKKRKFLLSTPQPSSHYSSPTPTIALLLPPHHSIRRNGNLSACEWKTSRLHHAVTVSLIVRTILPPTICLCSIFHYAPVFWLGTLCCDFKDV